MIKKVMWGTFMFLFASMTLSGMTGCDDCDPDYSNVLPPTVEAASHAVVGKVSTKNGDAVVGAAVTMGQYVATTDANGLFYISGVAPGKYEIKVEAPDLLVAKGDVVVKDVKQTQQIHWNAVLAADVKKEVAISNTTDTKEFIVTDAVEGNEKAEVKVVTLVPAKTVEAKEGAKIIVSPIYDAQLTTRATESLLLVGAKLSCTDKNAKITGKLELEFSIDPSMLKGTEARAFKGGRWVKVESKVVGTDKLVIYVDEFTAYGLFANVTFTTKNGSESVLNEKFDNLYGASPMPVKEVKYEFKGGLDIQGGSSVFEALLVEKLAAKYGNGVSSHMAVYPVNVVLPVGTMLQVSAIQEYTSVSAAASGYSVSGKSYGTVTVSTATANRQHEGGTN